MRSRRGGARKGAGRPTSAAREEAAEKAAAKIVESLQDAPQPYEALQALLTFHVRGFQECAAKRPYASRTEKFMLGREMERHSVSIRLTTELMSKFPAPQPDNTPQCVIVAPPVEPDAEAWAAKYKPAADAPPKPAANPQLEELRVVADALAERPKPRLVVDNDRPPLAPIIGPAPPSEIPMEFWADWSRGRR